MSAITVVTTFNKQGMDLYGQRFIESFEENVDESIKLFVYAEDCFPAIVGRHRVFELQTRQLLPKLMEFKKRWKDVPKANGIPPDDIKARRPRDHHKEFKWNAVRFANKVYAVLDAFERSTDWCVWMDADTFVHSNWSQKQFESLLPNDKWLTYVGRGKGSQTWPECGFYGMNKNHSMCVQFLKEFERFYEDAENGIFKLEEWHDSYVFGHILNIMKATDNNVLDYSAEMYLKEAKTGGGGHPLINTELGKYIDHMKGDRKNTGKSLQKDLMVNRKENYWQ
jgi:hypothetical protein